MDKETALRQRMFHGNLAARVVAEQLAARFASRKRRVNATHADGTSLVQIGSQHGTPVTVQLADTEGGVLVTMSRERDWLERVGDAGELIAKASEGSLLPLLAMIPDVIGELNEENLAPMVWDAVNELCSLRRLLAGEQDAPANPVICPYCEYANPPESRECAACGALLPVILPRQCPKCSRMYTSDALFCQSCGTRLVQG